MEIDLEKACGDAILPVCSHDTLLCPQLQQVLAHCESVMAAKGHAVIVAEP